jgi:predicted DNA-binding WGR domain protein
MPAAKRSKRESAALVPSTTAYLTCREGTSDKFYEVVAQGCDVLTRYGRRGAAGVASSKTFGTADEAAAFAASTVAEKLRKGYVYGEAEAAAANAIPVLTAPPFIPAPACKPAASTKAATKTAKAEVAPPQPLAGMTFCITGHVSTVRADFEADIVAHGGAVTKTVTASTTHLVCTQQGTKKCSDAVAKGLTVVDESWVRARVLNTSS